MGGDLQFTTLTTSLGRTGGSEHGKGPDLTSCTWLPKIRYSTDLWVVGHCVIGSDDFWCKIGRCAHNGACSRVCNVLHDGKIHQSSPAAAQVMASWQKWPTSPSRRSLSPLALGGWLVMGSFVANDNKKDTLSGKMCFRLGRLQRTEPGEYCWNVSSCV